MLFLLRGTLHKLLSCFLMNQMRRKNLQLVFVARVDCLLIVGVVVDHCVGISW